MSTLLHDIPSRTAFALGLTPRSLNDDDTGAAVELPDGDGPAFAVVQAGGVQAGTTVTVTIEQSSGDGSWSAVPATLPSLTADGVRAATFARTARYLRCQVAVAGGDPLAVVSVLFGQQKKVV